MSLHVLDPGLATFVVDRGRPRTRRLGVPVGGAADRWALALGNALVGNPPDAAALEITLSGSVLRADVPLACVLFGAPFAMRGRQPRLRAGKTFTLEAGEELHMHGTPEGVRAYFCVHGGLQTPRILDSCSGLAPVQAGDVFPCQSAATGSRFLVPDWEWNEEPLRLRVLPGPQADWFELPAFLAASYQVTPASNRMGLRLVGPPLALPARELVSEPVCPGAVQVTRDGQCIVLGIDGQTIGGYPKVVQVIAADLDKLAQLRPGATISFVLVTLAEAEELYRAKQRELREWLVRLQCQSVVQCFMGRGEGVRG